MAAKDFIGPGFVGDNNIKFIVTRGMAVLKPDPLYISMTHYLRGIEGNIITQDDEGAIKVQFGYGVPDPFTNTSDTFVAMEGYEKTGGDSFVVLEDHAGNIKIKII